MHEDLVSSTYLSESESGNQFKALNQNCSLADACDDGK